MGRGELIVCTGCGKTRPCRAKGLCARCYQRAAVAECARCGEVKRKAAKGLCHQCYKQVYRDPGIVERAAAVAERRKALAEQRAEKAAERERRRCATCTRPLIWTRGTVLHGTRYCDRFCQYHHPRQRATRGAKRWFSTVKAKLEDRQAQARQVEGMR